MTNLSAWLHKAEPYILSLVRVVVAGIFLLHGSQKLFGFPPGGHVVPLNSFVGFGGLLEFVGGLLLVLGLGVRPAAFILCGEMAVAYFLFHAPQGFFPIAREAGGNGGELAVLYCFIFLYYVVAGGGALSLDALFRRKPAA